MSNARKYLAFVGETMFPHGAPLGLTQGTSRFPAPLPAHASTEVAA